MAWPISKHPAFKQGGVFQLHCGNNAAGNFFSGISAWLGNEVVRLSVNQYRSSDDLGNLKAVSQNHEEGSSITGKQRWQVTGVGWMTVTAGVIVVSGIGISLTLAVVSFMNMKSKDPRITFRQTADVDNHQNTICHLIKLHRAE